MSYGVLNVANTMLNIANDRNISINLQKLQRLMYFAQGWSLALFDSPLIKEHVEAWELGPIFPTVYHEFKYLGNDPINSVAVRWDARDKKSVPYEPVLDQNVLFFLNDLFNKYGNFTSIELSKMATVRGGPWESFRTPNMYRNTNIPEKMIVSFFKGELQKYEASIGAEQA